MLKAIIFLGVCVYNTAGLSHSTAPLLRQKRSGNTCLTTPESRDPGAKCVFPFKYNGTTYNGCPPDIVDASKGGWCSTKTDSNGNHVTGEGKYGYCSKSCPTHSEKASIGLRSAGLEDFEGVDHGECTIVYQEECKPFKVFYTHYESKCGTVKVKECGHIGHKYHCMKVYKIECKNVPKTKHRTDQHCEKVSYKRCGENNELSRLNFEPTDAEDCKIGWKKYHIAEHKDTSTKVCTTKNERACVNKTLEVCEFVKIKVPFTETIEKCETKTVKQCQQHWACKDKGWTKESGDPCQQDEYRDDPSTCIELPQTECKPTEITIEVEERKRECKNIDYEDCSAKVPTETCTYKKKREPTYYVQSLPHIVCKSCETEYRSIYKTIYELQHVKKCMDMPKKICQYLDEKVCRISGWSHKEICQYETMEKCYKKHEEVCHTHSHKIPKSQEVKVPKTVCRQSYLGFVEGER